MEDLVALYDALAVPTSTGEIYVARPINDRLSYRIAKDQQGHPTLLIAPDTTRVPSSVPPLELRNLAFRPRCTCEVRIEGRSDSVETLAVLKCTSEDRALREYFLRTLSVTIAALPDPPTEDEIGTAVARLVELFRALQAPPRRSLQGLWCELFLIARAPRIRQAATAWHADPSALHDFVAGRQRIEVKSSNRPHRIHNFSLDQLLPPVGTTVVIASFVLEEGVRGLSIGDLWDEVAGRTELTPALRERLAHILALALGRDWRRAQRVAFDPEQAADSLSLYDAQVIPKVDPNLPVEVSDVRFRAELTDVQPLTSRAVAVQGGLFNAMWG